MTQGEARAALAAAGIPDPAREARLLLAHADGAPDTFAALVRRRAAREPMAFITGRQGFWTLDLVVSPATLIPRADSETLIETALAAFPERTAVGRVLDLGTGTGALLLAALSEFPAAWGLGIDLSPYACALARRNAAANGMDTRAVFLAGHWAASLGGRFDLILANPPYVERAALAGLMPEVALFEPARALDGGADGLDAYRAILPDVERLLAPCGLAVLELGDGQAGAVAALATECGLSVMALRRDLGGIDRAISVKKQVGSRAGDD